ncbi:unnamed protein product [Vicia faba]|uniref:Uncharacterized protein n=1 Tax=Vicia faba TaxID=3906 RepID=A0AAV0YMF8_VICFA|nr:unnamed protein product [Vicia faba]
MGSPQADARSTQVPKNTETACAAVHNRDNDVSVSISTTQAWATITIRVSRYPESIGRPALTVPHPTQTHHRPLSPSLPIILITLGLSFQSPFHLSLAGCIPKQPDSPTAPRGVIGFKNNGALTLSGAPFQGTWARSSAEDASPNYNSNAEDDRFSWGLIPVATPNLRSHHEHLEMHMGRRSLKLMESGATCVQRLDGSRNFVMHTKYRISLRSSSMQEPRYPLTRVILYHVSKHNPHENCLWCHAGIDNDPSAGSPTETLLRLLLLLNDKVQWTSHNIAGNGPPTSPQSKHFTGPSS